MLILWRSKGEVITVGDDIEITVIDIGRFGRNSCHLGIQAPPEVEIVRGELSQQWRKRRKDDDKAAHKPKSD